MKNKDCQYSLKSKCSESDDFERRFLRLSETVPCGLYEYYLDSQGKSYFPYFNARFLDILEIDREDLIENGSLVWGLFHPDDRDRIYQEDINANAAGSLFFVETRIKLLAKS